MGFLDTFKQFREHGEHKETSVHDRIESELEADMAKSYGMTATEYRTYQMLGQSSDATFEQPDMEKSPEEQLQERLDADILKLKFECEADTARSMGISKRHIDNARKSLNDDSTKSLYRMLHNNERQMKAVQRLGFKDSAEYYQYCSKRNYELYNIVPKTGGMLEEGFLLKLTDNDILEKHPSEVDSIDLISEIYFGDKSKNFLTLKNSSTLVGYRFMNNTDDSFKVTVLSSNSENEVKLNKMTVKPHSQFICNQQTIAYDLHNDGIWTQSKYCKNVVFAEIEDDLPYLAYKGMQKIQKENLSSEEGLINPKLVQNVFGNIYVKACIVKYQVRGRIMDGSKSIGYRVYSSTGYEKNISREEFIDLCNKKLVINCESTIDKKGNVTLNGIGCNLNDLPKLNVNETHREMHSRYN